ncbi:MAG TPA: hypothetical protein VM600_04280 [Actinomycetota bacterium]|nr:hypothetical protein [Actinomycetota bacterium]
MIRKLFAVALLVGGVLAPLPGKAATVRYVEARNHEFVGWSVFAQAGDTIEWEVTNSPGGGHQHSMTAYFPDADPGTPGTQPVFDLGPHTAAYQRFQFSGYAGGEIRYRCKFHSTLTEAGQCSGMCGIITDTAPANLPSPPTITVPQNNQTVTNHAVVMSWNAPAGAAFVRIRQCTASGCYLEIAKVPASQNSVTRDFANGTYTIRASSVHQDGFESPLSTPVTFNVRAEDRTAPVVDVQSPRDGVTLNPIKLSVRVTDDVGIKPLPEGVKFTIRDVLTGADTDVTPRCVSDPCNAWDAQYAAERAMPSGVYDVIVTAVDASGRTDGTDRRTVTRRVILVF